MTHFTEIFRVAITLLATSVGVFVWALLERIRVQRINKLKEELHSLETSPLTRPMLDLKPGDTVQYELKFEDSKGQPLSVKVTTSKEINNEELIRVMNAVYETLKSPNSDEERVPVPATVIHEAPRAAV